ncbi:MAG: putative CRISPR-associated protein [Candidatus Korarchaeum sp.]|nr:putative CRISPR-associated protein [Candidatus Korarchaeum sp.]MDW8035253.1 putative CRISPR-associated protein [Candidatus Korarchaeum sp.]
MTECHVIACGISLLRNFAESQVLQCSSILWKHPELKNSLRDPSKIEGFLKELSDGEKASLRGEILSYLKQDPRRASAELNSLFGYIEDVKRGKVEDIRSFIEEVHLMRSDTESGRLTVDVLSDYLSSLGLRVNSHAVGGFGSQDFDNAIRDLVRKVRGVVRSCRGEIVFNVTGGYKVETAAMAVLAAESDIKQYYIHETSGRVVLLPPTSELKVRMTSWEKLLTALTVLINLPFSFDPMEMAFKAVVSAAIIWIVYRKV